MIDDRSSTADQRSSIDGSLMFDHGYLLITGYDTIGSVTQRCTFFNVLLLDYSSLLNLTCILFIMIFVFQKNLAIISMGCVCGNGQLRQQIRGKLFIYFIHNF